LNPAWRWLTSWASRYKRRQTRLMEALHTSTRRHGVMIPTVLSQIDFLKRF
jgi:hypothetical protein